jgi:hypothetical protein
MADVDIAAGRQSELVPLDSPVHLTPLLSWGLAHTPTWLTADANPIDLLKKAIFLFFLVRLAVRRGLLCADRNGASGCPWTHVRERAIEAEWLHNVPNCDFARRGDLRDPR